MRLNETEVKIRMEGERTSGSEISEWMEAERQKWLEVIGWGWRMEKGV